MEVHERRDFREGDAEFALKVEEMMWEQIVAGWDGREHYVAALERITRLEETEDLLARSVCRTLIE